MKTTGDNETIRFEVILQGDLKDQFLRRKEAEKLDKNATLGKKLIALQLEQLEAQPETSAAQ